VLVVVVLVVAVLVVAVFVVARVIARLRGCEKPAWPGRPTAGTAGGSGENQP
jgi:hypothetical protein